MSRTFLIILAALAGIYLLVCAAIYGFQRRIIFLPSRAGDAPPADLGIREVLVNSSGGNTLHGWWMPVDSAQYTLVFFHGNAGCVSKSEERLRFFRALGYSTLIVDYRGYGKSSGRIEEEQNIYDDARATLAFARDSLHVPMDKLIVWGWSLGGAVTVEVCQDIRPAAVVLEGTFYSMDDIARNNYPVFPISLMLKYHFRSGEKISRLQSPLFFIHSKNDFTIPYEQGRKLYDAATARKQFLDIDGSHNHGFNDHANVIGPALREFLGS